MGDKPSFVRPGHIHVSWNTIVVHSRDNQEVGMVHEVKSPKNQPQFSQMTMGQYWLGVSLNKLSDQPEMLSKSFYRIKKNL